MDNETQQTNPTSSQPTSGQPTNGQLPTTTNAGTRSGEDGVMIFLSYFGIFALIPYLTVKDSDFIKFHSKQGLTMTGVFVAAWVALMIINVIPILGTIISILGNLVLGLGGLALFILALVKAFGGEKWRIPVIADLADKW